MASVELLKLELPGTQRSRAVFRAQRSHRPFFFPFSLSLPFVACLFQLFQELQYSITPYPWFSQDSNTPSPWFSEDSNTPSSWFSENSITPSLCFPASSNTPSSWSSIYSTTPLTGFPASSNTPSIV